MLTALLTLTICAFTQNTVTDAKGNTSSVAVREREMSDTIKGVMIFYGEGTPAEGKVKYCKGSVIRKGFAVEKEKGKWEYVQQPTITAIVDEKWKLVTNILQIL